MDTNGFLTGLVTGAIAEIPATSAVDPDPSGDTGIRFEVSPTVADSFMQLHFVLPRAASVSCRVYDVRGRCVRTVATGSFAAGVHEVAWNAQDDLARPVHSGSYLIRLQVDGASRVLKVVIMH